MAMALASAVMETGLGRCHHVGRVLHRPGLEQHLPVVLAGERREGGGHHQHIHALGCQVAVELGETHVVANGEADPAKPGHIHDGGQNIPRFHRGRLPIGVAIGQVHIEEVDLVVLGQNLALMAHQFGPVVGLAWARRHGEAAP